MMVVVASSAIMTVGGGYLLIRLLPATGATRRLVLNRALKRDEGNPYATAAALAAAMETPRMAFAPSFDLLGVPSSSIMNVSKVA